LVDNNPFADLNELSDINWAENRLRVPSPKTEHHTGGESRLIPKK